MSTYSETSLIKVTFNGRNGSGYISVPGVKVGDILIAPINPPNPISVGEFPGICDTADSIFQISEDDHTDRAFVGVMVRFA